MIKIKSIQKGFSLIEILVAMSTLVIFILPVMSLFMLGARGNEFNTSWQDGTKLAHSVMNRLLSEDVPFTAIDPEGFTGGSTAMGGSRSQMEFRSSFGPNLDFSNDNLKEILGAKNGAYKLLDGDRIVVKGRRKYKIMVWAGIYKNKSGNSSLTKGSDPYQSNATKGDELTFSYFRNPWFDQSNDCVIDYSINTCVETSKNRPIAPYTQQAGNISALDHIKNGIAPKSGSNFNDRYRPGWATDERIENKDFHNFEDLDNDNNDDGAFMKIIVGVQWKPKGWGAGGTARPQEFYLVSFKANLQGANQ
ncbi:MAG: hypothetical protein COB02_17220 [Candidatus Cloacimonadota bacterium]|nr:MAG: hypothetical protein COB02_17220 [Candidatus Cloacimonadota bacterium]